MTSDASAALNAQTKTTCPYCGVGCGVTIDQTADGALTVRGDPDHPANFGRLCSKGSALGETLGLSGRLLQPRLKGRTASWDEAIEVIAKEFLECIARHGPDSIAFYVSGQLLTEDYYVVNKLAKGFVGTGNIDTNSRLCMASSVAAHRRAFGSDTVPGCYEDLDEADLIVLVGSNSAWCHPVLHQRMMAAKARYPHKRMVVIDPRRTEACEGAELHLPIRSGSDAVLFNGLLNYLQAAGGRDSAFVDDRTTGADAALAVAADQSIANTARICGLNEGSVELFFNWFLRTEKVTTLYSQGINQSSSGVDKVNAIINCHLLTGRLGKPGMGPFSLTGQPNAMGGREVGGLANQLAAHLDIENPLHRDLVRAFWGSDQIAQKPGFKAVDMFRAIEDGRVKALWIMSTNPAVSLPDADRVRRALSRCDFVVVSDILEQTDTNAFADVLLPAAAWGEKNGTVTNSERRISRQRSFLQPPGSARPDWKIVCDVAKAMGYPGFDFASPAEIFREHAALSGYENDGSRDFDISALAAIDARDYENLSPIQWPVTAQHPKGEKRVFGDGRFYTPDGRARFIPVSPRPPKNATTPDYPLVLNTGRVRDHWHTLTRTARSARLSAHIFEPYAEFHYEDARRIDVADGDLVRLSTAYGAMVARAKVGSEQRRGCVFVPMHWTEQFSSNGRVNALVNPEVDPISGQPESKHTPVRAEPRAPTWQALAMARRPLTPLADSEWTIGRAQGAWRMEFWGEAAPADWGEAARALFADGEEFEWILYKDVAAGHFRCTAVRNERLEACLYVSPARLPMSRSWLAGLFQDRALTDLERRSLMAGRALEQGADIGQIVCSCFGVGQNQIAAAIRSGADSIDRLGETLKAGSNCGSCKPELARLLAKRSSDDDRRHEPHPAA